jgi:hypothetical protein
MQKRCVSIFAKVSAILLLCGCEPTLETGYKPRPLNSTPEDRRAYYAPAFTPESHPPKDKGNGFGLQ